MTKNANIVTLARKQPRWRILAAILVIAAAGYFLLGKKEIAGKGTTFVARRGPLEIAVLEGGSLQALESQEIKCEVRVGYQGLKILKIVEEGYQVTEDDLRTNKVLVELDSSDIQKQIVQQEIQYQSAAASFTDAQQGYDIQLNQNISDTKAAEQKSKFARMDFEKFMGAKAAEEIIGQLNLDADPSPENTSSLVKAITEASAPPNAQTTNAANAPLVPLTDAPKVIQIASANGSSPSGPAINPTSIAPNTPAKPKDEASLEAMPKPVELPQTVAVDFSKYASIDLLGDGEAKQKLRKFQDDLQVAQKELGQSKATLEGTQRLYAKGFVTKTDSQRDEIAYENSRLKVQTAETARDLFLKYEFLKSAEESLSKYAEARRELERARRAAVSKLAQAEAKLKSAQGQYNVQTRQRKELNEQLDKCIIRAKKPGLVVYGGGGEDQYYYGGEERIREGATVRERQSIITIPDMTKMAVKVKIHESYVKKVKKGQKVRITVDAFPEKKLEGEVTKVGVLPDSQNRWMNPDLKVYVTTITIIGTQDWVKPGMSAKAEIVVNKLADVVYVPVQAVTPSEGKQFCYIDNGVQPERREVEIGEFNDEFIEIKKGLKEGEKVSLRAPEATEKEQPDKDKKPADAEKPKPDQPPPTKVAAGQIR